MEGDFGTMTKKVGLIGYGYWGKNLARCFKELGVLWAIADQDEKKVYEANEILGVSNLAADLEALLALGCDAVAIATPPETHYDLACQVLRAKKDVFIEKPMTTSYDQATGLVNLANLSNVNLVVGHIYLHNEGIQRMPIPVGRSELYVQLLNEGGPPSESTRDLAWAGLPHACSLALHFFPDWPVDIEVDRDDNRIKAVLSYWNGSEVYLDVGDYTGRKLRRVELRIQDSRYLFDVTNPEGVTLLSGIESTSFGYGQDKKKTEPLLVECKAFLEYEGVDPMGPKVVKLIEEILSECKS